MLNASKCHVIIKHENRPKNLYNNNHILSTVFYTVGGGKLLKYDPADMSRQDITYRLECVTPNGLLAIMILCQISQCQIFHYFSESNYTLRIMTNSYDKDL